MKNKLILSFLLFIGGFLELNAQQSTDSLIYKELVREGYSARHASYWIKVSRYETANYSSTLCKHHNNLWGMSYFKKGRRQTQGVYRVYHNGKPTRFAGYKTRESAVKEITLYLKEAKYPKDFVSLNHFIKFMKSKGYFEEPIAYYMKGISNF